MCVQGYLQRHQTVLFKLPSAVCPSQDGPEEPTKGSPLYPDMSLPRQLHGAKATEANLDGIRPRDDTGGQQAYFDLPGLWY